MAWKSGVESWRARTRRKQRQGAGVGNRKRDTAKTRRGRAGSSLSVANASRLNGARYSFFFLEFLFLSRKNEDRLPTVLRFPLVPPSNLVPSDCFSLFIRGHGTRVRLFYSVRSSILFPPFICLSMKEILFFCLSFFLFFWVFSFSFFFFYFSFFFVVVLSSTNATYVSVGE